MVFQRIKDDLASSAEDIKLLEDLSNSKTAESRKVERARILLRYCRKEKPDNIAA